MCLYLGLDIGGTNMTGALADVKGRRSRTLRRKTDPQSGARGGIAAILEIARLLLDRAAQEGRRIHRLGVGFGGPVDAKTGTVLMSHHVKGWENMPLRQRLQDELGLPVTLDNDCNAGALGEWRFGAGRGVRDLLYVNIGTGIGGGVIAGGRLIQGTASGAGEIGHMVIDPDGPSCTCGKRGCLESLCSGPAIALRARRRAVANATSSPLTQDSTSEDVFRAASDGDSLAKAMIEETGGYLAHAIGNAVVMLNPERVILGGGVAEAGDLLLEPIRRRLADYVLPHHADSVRIEKADLGYDAGVMGAVALALEGEKTVETPR